MPHACLHALLRGYSSSVQQTAYVYIYFRYILEIVTATPYSKFNTASVYDKGLKLWSISNWRV